MPVVTAGHENAAVAFDGDRTGPVPTGSQVGCDQSAGAEGGVKAAVGLVVAGQGHFVVAAAVQDRTGHHDIVAAPRPRRRLGHTGGERRCHKPTGAETRIGVAVVRLARIVRVADQPKLAAVGSAGHQDIAVVQGHGGGLIEAGIVLEIRRLLAFVADLPDPLGAVSAERSTACLARIIEASVERAACASPK